MIICIQKVQIQCRCSWQRNIKVKTATEVLPRSSRYFNAAKGHRGSENFSWGQTMSYIQARSEGTRQKAHKAQKLPYMSPGKTSSLDDRILIISQSQKVSNKCPLPHKLCQVVWSVSEPNLKTRRGGCNNPLQGQGLNWEEIIGCHFYFKPRTKPTLDKSNKV